MDCYDHAVPMLPALLLIGHGETEACGIFAQLLGTLWLLELQERTLVKGL